MKLRYAAAAVLLVLGMSGCGRNEMVWVERGAPSVMTLTLPSDISSGYQIVASSKDVPIVIVDAPITTAITP